MARILLVILCGTNLVGSQPANQPACQPASQLAMAIKWGVLPPRALQPSVGVFACIPINYFSVGRPEADKSVEVCVVAGASPSKMGGHPQNAILDSNARVASSHISR